MITQSRTYLSDCQFAYNGTDAPGLEFDVVFDLDLVIVAIGSALEIHGFDWWRAGAVQFTVHTVIQGINTPIIVQIWLRLLAPMQTRIRMRADHCTMRGGVTPLVMKELNSFKQLFQIECCNQIGLVPSWLHRLAHDKTTSQLVLTHLSMQADPEIRIAVANNTFTPLAALQSIARDKNPRVRFAVAENHNSPKPLLNCLAQDSSPDVAFSARKTLERVELKKSTFVA